MLGLIASVVGFFLEATHAFVQPTMVAAAPTVMNTPPGGPLLVGVFGGDLLILVGLVTLGVSAFRQRVWPRPAAVLLIIGMVAAPFGSVAALPMGIGLLWAGWSGLKARSAVADDPARRQSLPA